MSQKSRKPFTLNQEQSSGNSRARGEQFPRVLVFGAGGLGHPACQLLAQLSEIQPEITVCDGDRIQLSNLNRQFLFSDSQVGEWKAETLAAALGKNVHALNIFPDRMKCRELIDAADFVIDATDSIRQKFLTNDLCVELGKPFAYAGVVGERGVFLSYRPGEACLRCVFGDYTEEDFAREQASCQSAGIIGAVCGIFGALMASAAENWFLGRVLPQEIVRYDSQNGIQSAAVRRDPSCSCHH